MSKATEIREQIGVSKTITLNFPTKLADGRTLTELTVRRAKVGDYRAVAHLESDATQEIALLGRLEELDLSDYAQLQEWFRQCQQKPSEEQPKAD